MKKLNIWQRVISDTPIFFKRAQILGISLVTLATTLSGIGYIPGQLITIVTTIGATITAISQFAVKQYEQN